MTTARPWGLTLRELEVSVLLADGSSNKEIATSLCIGVPAAKFHVSQILRKLAVDSRTRAALRLRGVLDPK